MELTDAGFWDLYWQKHQIPNEIDLNFSFERCLASELTRLLRNRQGQSILEVGCAPGRWLAFFGKSLGLKPSGIEYSAVGGAITEQNMKSLGVDYGEILRGDFFAIEPRPFFDIVVSFGFIEHFDNPFDVMKRQLAWLAPGGLAVFGVPNFRGIYQPLQRFMDPDILRRHNLDTMRIEFFEDAQGWLGMELTDVRRIGSFEPSLPLSNRHGGPLLSTVRRSLSVLSRIRNRLPFLDRINGRAFSSYILAAYGVTPGVLTGPGK